MVDRRTILKSVSGAGAISLSGIVGVARGKSSKSHGKPQEAPPGRDIEAALEKMSNYISVDQDLRLTIDSKSAQRDHVRGHHRNLAERYVKMHNNLHEIDFSLAVLDDPGIVTESVRDEKELKDIETTVNEVQKSLKYFDSYFHLIKKGELRFDPRTIGVPDKPFKPKLTGDDLR